jgi:putative endopeptidase
MAYETFLQTKQAKDGILIDGLTPQQRFFLSFARSWRMKMTNAKLLSTIKIDPHAPAIDRVNGPLSNMMGFYQIFNVTKGDRMFREPSKRVLIW